MTQILQDFIARMDMSLPWLLPILETLEQTVPSTARLTMCAALMVGFAFLRHRNAAASHLHRAAL